MTYFLGILFAASTVLWLTYWMIVRPYLLDSIRTDYYELKSALDWAIIENLPGSQSEAAATLAKQLSYSRGMRSASISPAIYIQLVKGPELRAHVEKHRILVNSSQDWLKQMWVQSAKLGMKATLTNSPFLWIPLAVVLLAAIFSYKVALWWKQTEEAASSLSCPQT